jgi:hypothetical protein
MAECVWTIGAINAWNRVLLATSARSEPKVAALTILGMDIEEWELLYSPAEPLRAWRLFRVRPAEDGWVLFSPMYHNPEPPPWPQVGSDSAPTLAHRASGLSITSVTYASLLVAQAAR